jgi:hypothetical protein
MPVGVRYADADPLLTALDAANDILCLDHTDMPVLRIYRCPEYEVEHLHKVAWQELCMSENVGERRLD